MTERQATDLTIIGAGPAGLYAAYYAGFRGLSVTLVDSLPEPGGQVAALYPEKAIYDVAGFPEVRGKDLIDQCVRQADQYDPTYLLGHRAEDLEKRDDGTFLIRTHKGVEVLTKAVIITGARDSDDDAQSEGHPVRRRRPAHAVRGFGMPERGLSDLLGFSSARWLRQDFGWLGS